MTFLGIVCGLKSEATEVASLRDADLRVGVSGANAQRAEEIARRFCDEGAAAIVSVGVSGGLDPSLVPGDLVIGSHVVSSDGKSFVVRSFVDHYSVHPREGGDPSERSALDPHLRGDARISFRSGVLFGSDEIIADDATKARLFSAHGAIAVDMESHGAARAAHQAGIPFFALRAIADPADRALPQSALDAVAPDGSTRVISTLMKCAMRPGDFPKLLQLGRDSDAALKALRGALPEAIAAIRRALATKS